MFLYINIMELVHAMAKKKLVYELLYFQESK